MKIYLKPPNESIRSPKVKAAHFVYEQVGRNFVILKQLCGNKLGMKLTSIEFDRELTLNMECDRNPSKLKQKNKTKGGAK
jgi:hypothetical protein